MRNTFLNISIIGRQVMAATTWTRSIFQTKSHVLKQQLGKSSPPGRARRTRSVPSLKLLHSKQEEN